MADTIAAVASGAGVSAIGTIRISGADAIGIISKVFRTVSGKTLENAEDRNLYYGSLTDKDGNVIDMCMCWISRGPKSYTGEDTAELQCHGSPAVLSECLKTLFHYGARHAEPGEFTKRAFINGKMDLMQAEAVADIIDAETAVMARSAAGKLQSSIAGVTDKIYDELLNMLSHFHAVIDYPDEDIEEFKLEEYAVFLSAAEARLNKLLVSFERGRMIKDGVYTAIIGRPNVGKSSLLNAFLGYERAIVTEIPGTTRDTVEEKLVIGEHLIRLCDTAGIRQTEDVVEKIGVERSLAAAENAELVIAVIDGSRALSDDDREILRKSVQARFSVAVINKTDLETVVDEQAVREEAKNVCCISASSGAGMEKLEKIIAKLLSENDGDIPLSDVITNQRQAEEITKAKNSITGALEALNFGMTPDAVVIELERALGALGALSGRTAKDDVVARIFSRFCVGK